MLRSILGVILLKINNNNLTYRVGLSIKKLVLLVLEKYNLVELRGIEPLSKNNNQYLSTGLVSL